MFSNIKSIPKKLMIVLLVLTLISSNFILVGSNLFGGLISYALEDEEILEEGTDNEVKFEVNVESKDIHKTRMEESTEYTEKINLSLKNVSSVSVEDKQNTFYDKDENEVETANLKYVKTVINLETLKSLLENEGKFEVLDSEGNKLVELSYEKIAELETAYLEAQVEDENAIPTPAPQTFTKIVEVENDHGEMEEQEQEEIRSYVTVSAEKVEITYEQEVNNLKFNIENINPEFGKLIANSEIPEENEEDEANEEDNGVDEVNFVIENTKSIFDVSDLENLNYLKEEKTYSYSAIEFENEENEDQENSEEEQTEVPENNEEVIEETTIENIIKFKSTITRATLESENAEWEMGTTNYADYRITLNTTEEDAELFANPLFILELPESVESINTANSQFTVENDGGVFYDKQVSVITLLGRKYVVIQFKGEQTSESIANGNAFINLSLELGIKDGEEETQETKLYYKNDTVTAYESGVGFDTDAVDIELVLASEDRENIGEENTTPSDTEPSTNNATDFIRGYVDVINENKAVRVGDEFEFIINIDKYSSSIENAIIEDIIPNGLEYVDAKLYEYNEEDGDYTTEINTEDVLQYNQGSKVLTVDYDKLEMFTTSVLKIKVKASNLEQGEYIKEINNTVKVLVNEEITETENLTVKVSDAFLEASKVDAVEKARIEDAITYEINISNLGLFASEEETITIKIPEELEPGSISIGTEGEEGYLSIPMFDNEKEITIIVGAGETIVIKITAIYNTVVENNKYVTATATIGDNELTWTTKLLRVGNYGEDVEIGDDEEPSNPENPNDPANPSNPENPTDPTNPSNPENPTDPTNPSNPENPNDPTDPSNPGDPTNPDNPENPNGENTEKPEFDLSLSQSLKKITVTNEKGTTVYEYKDTNFAKVEIHSKQMNSSLVTLEYEITVKNEGTIPGYARKIVDYIPSGLTFNSELNKDWYQGEDGNLYSVAFIDKLLEPEDTETLKLVLTKQMSNENTGTIINIAEICEATNGENEPDINSTPGDKKENQNDMAKVEVLITVATGTIILYTMLAITVLAILGYGIIKVKNITLKKEGK